MKVEIVTPPAAEPIDLDEAKLELRIDSAEEDTFVSRLIASSRAFFEKETGFALINRTLRAHLRFWPKATNILLPYPPLVSVTSVTHYPLGVATVLEPSAYLEDNQSRQGSIMLVPGTSWPSGVLYPPGVTIEYVAGFGAAAGDVPEDILQALMGLITFWYDTPEAVYVPGDNKTSGKPVTLPLGTQEVIDRYREERER